MPLLIQILPEKKLENKILYLRHFFGKEHILPQRVTPERFLDKAHSFILNYVTAQCSKTIIENYGRQNRNWETILLWHHLNKKKVYHVY